MPPPSVRLQVRELGDPILRSVARPVENVQDPEIQELINDMIEKCIEIDGVGIAAPQVGKPLRLFIIASRPSPRYPQAPHMEPTAIINPSIIKTCPTEVSAWEGCLSIPGLRAQVVRPSWVETAYIDRNGECRVTTFKGFIARIFQHEFDHLEGKLFVDRADPLEMVTEKEYQRILKENPPV